MTATRLTRPNVTWALALDQAFVDWSHPTVAELNDRRFVHLISCALTEDGTELTWGNSETDTTTTFCSIGNEITLSFANVTGSLQWLLDANTGGSGSTVDLTSLYNKVTAMLGAPDVPYWLIKRVGPNASQDTNFAVGHNIQMAHFKTDQEQYVLEQNKPERGLQNLLFQGEYLLNYPIAS
jgi:hypothetical protein